MTVSDIDDRIRVPREQIAAFCRRNHIRRLALFGSVIAFAAASAEEDMPLRSLPNVG